MVQIRRAGSRDLPAIAAIHAASWKDAYRGILPDNYLRHGVVVDLQRHWQTVELRPDDVILVADDNGIAGFVAVWCRPEPFIDNLHVTPEMRSRGLGRALLEAAAACLMQMGRSTAYLWVLEANRRALAFYEGLGGMRLETANKPVFGHLLPSVKVQWSDLSVLARGG